jgi:hypothetical protein
MTLGNAQSALEELVMRVGIKGWRSRFGVRDGTRHARRGRRRAGRSDARYMNTESDAIIKTDY